jgi:hypothetical protein
MTDLLDRILLLASKKQTPCLPDLQELPESKSVTPAPFFERLLSQKSKEKPSSAATSKFDSPFYAISDDTRRLYENTIKSMMEQHLAESEDIGRNRYALILAGEMKKLKWDRTKAVEHIAEWNTGNNPPMPDNELDIIMNQAYDEVYDHSPNNWAILEHHRDKAKRKIDFVPEEPDDGKLWYTWEDILDTPDFAKPVEPLGRWLLWEGRIGVLYADRKMGKGTLAAYEIAEIAKNNPDIKVLYIANDEGADEVAKRYLNEGNPIIPRSTNIAFCIGSYCPTTWGAAGERIEEFKPDVIILDSILSILNLWENKGNSSIDNSEFMKWGEAIGGKFRSMLTAIGLEKTSVLWLHHTNRQGSFLGSAGIGAAPDIMIHMWGSRFKPERVIQYEARAGIGMHGKKVNLTYSHETGYVDNGDLPSKDSALSPLEKWVTSVLKDGPMSTKAIKELYEKRFQQKPTSSLDRVKQSLGIESYKEGIIYMWKLPEQDEEQHNVNDLMEGEEND